ncbi:D-lactate dehydrogenase [Acinetobacter calcoaceticus]|uniref:D-lactate dehydrogenase n=1 Tax=Acinetobacter calcoaceticus TaxID=471 RepID=A0A4R1XBU2_ACICA|nr:D-lactate dehydrogenase [Acinetobacter calcoaceticus]
MKQKEIISELLRLLTPAQVLTKEIDKASYVKGFRVGKGEALAVAIPHSLLEIWQVLEICVKHDVIIIMQASNTGVTGGSTPDSNDYDRDVVIISTRKLNGVQLLDQATQVIAFPGTTLTELENALKPYQREPHSVIGSSCIGASVIGGVCNNSGGSLIRRGPAYTEKSLFAQVDASGELKLVNHLGIALGQTPAEIFKNLEGQQYSTGTCQDWEGRIWADNYADSLRDTTSATPTRYNGNAEYLHDSSGSSGKIAVFAVRLPTFEAAPESVSYYIGSNDESEFIGLRKYILEQMTSLPSQAEYIHRHAFDLTRRYAKHMYKAIDIWGAEKIPELFAAKVKFDRFFKKIPLLPNNSMDRLVQIFNRVTPAWIAPRILDFHEKYEHHLLIKLDIDQKDEFQALLQNFFKDRPQQYFECSPKEQKNAFLIRFAVGGCVVYYCDSMGIDTNQRLVSFDVALRRNDNEWMFRMPQHLQDQVLLESCCGHFMCFVVHQDYLLKPGVDANQFKQDVLQYIESRGAKYPAEHNVGHLYAANEDYKQFWNQLDPTNSFNPGIGKTSKCKHWH